MTDAQQGPYLTQAEGELLALYIETKTETNNGTPSRRLIQSRAKSLYQKHKQSAFKSTR